MAGELRTQRHRGYQDPRGDSGDALTVWAVNCSTPFKLLALQIGALGALCPWFPPDGPWMMLAGGERISEAIGARHCAAPGWVKVSRH
jgi:hypothetical protein